MALLVGAPGAQSLSAGFPAGAFQDDQAVFQGQSCAAFGADGFKICRFANA